MPDLLTPGRLDEVRVRLAARTQGVWYVAAGRATGMGRNMIGVVSTANRRAVALTGYADDPETVRAESLADADFIAHAPTDIALLLAEVERLRSAVTLDSLIPKIRAWQAETFPLATPASVTEHLRREATELAAAPDDEEEMADVFILLVAASRGHDLLGAVRRKMEKNRTRQWGVPDATGVVEHIREAAGA